MLIEQGLVSPQLGYWCNSVLGLAHYGLEANLTKSLLGKPNRGHKGDLHSIQTFSCEGFNVLAEEFSKLQYPANLCDNLCL